MPFFRTLRCSPLMTIALTTLVAGCSNSTSLTGTENASTGGATAGDLRMTIEARITSSESDGEERANGTIELYDQSLNFGYDVNNKQTVGLRFENIPIPKGATIESARLRFSALADQSQPTSIIVTGIADPKTPPFSEQTRDISSRIRISATALWSVLPWQAEASDQATPDLANIVQEIVELPDWEQGDNLSFVLEGRGARSAYSYDGSADKAPVLDITYKANGVSDGSGGQVFEYAITSAIDDGQERSDDGSVKLISDSLNLGYGIGSMAASNPVVGLRFNNIEIPAGSSILSAYVQFTSNLKTYEPFFIHLTIKGEASDSAQPFETTDYAISSRPQTNAVAFWDPEPWAGRLLDGPDQRTSDLSEIIAEIVQRPGWEAGNSIALMISGPGEASTRFASAYENDPDFAPKLHIVIQR